MKSILGRLMRKELGMTKYCCYAEYYQDICEDRKKEMTKNEEVFDDMFDLLQSKDLYSLNDMLKRLLDGVCDTIRISRHFVFAVVLYAVTMIVLFVCIPGIYLMLGGIALATIAFGYKLSEFLSNRYCYVDLRIMLVYKIVLYQLIKIKSEK